MLPWAWATDTRKSGLASSASKPLRIYSSLSSGPAAAAAAAAAVAALRRQNVTMMSCTQMLMWQVLHAALEILQLDAMSGACVLAPWCGPLVLRPDTTLALQAAAL